MQYDKDKLAEPSPLEDLYAELYRRYAPALLAYVCLHVSPREDAEDIVLDVFLSVLQHPRFSAFPEQQQEAWLWTIARNKTVDHFRRTSRQKQMSIEWLAETLYADDRDNPEQISLRREAHILLAQAVYMLPLRQQEVLRLRFGHGLNSTEIAQVLEKSGSAVRVLLSRTLRLLRNHYTSQEEEDL